MTYIFCLCCGYPSVIQKPVCYYGFKLHDNMNKYPVTMHVVNDLMQATVYSTEHVVFLFGIPFPSVIRKLLYIIMALKYVLT